METDNYPEEVAWSLTNKCDTNFTLSSPQYSLSSVLQTTIKCIPRGKYEFTITDTYDDGICCNFGEGRYEILVNGRTKHIGGQFGRLESKTFGSCPSEIVASRVRVQLESRNCDIYLHMREVEVWAKNGTNVALNKPANQSSTWVLEGLPFPASNAVDGVVDIAFPNMSYTLFEQGKCRESACCALL